MSINQKLREVAQTSGIGLRQVRDNYAIERFLFRLSISKYADCFFLKGAQMFKVWKPEMKLRATQDADFFARGINHTHSQLRQVILEICSITDYNGKKLSQSDFTSFRWGNTTNLQAIQIESGYYGTRISNLEAQIDGITTYLFLDIGFDSVLEEPRNFTFPVLLPELQSLSPQLQGYPPELSFAEKFVTMVEKGPTNSRLKDFYDLYALCKSDYLLDIRALRSEIQRVFASKNIPPEIPSILRSLSTSSNQFRRTWHNLMQSMSIDLTIEEVCSSILQFVRRKNLL